MHDSFSSSEAALLLVSAKTRDLGKVQHQKLAIHGFPVTLRMLRVKSDKSDWLRIQNGYSAYAYAHKIGPYQRSRFLVLTKRSVASGDENVHE